MPSNKRICKTKNKTVRNIPSIAHSKSTIFVPTIMQNLLMRDKVNAGMKEKRASYATSEIVSQLTIQHPKSKSSKRGSVTNSQNTRKKLTTNDNFPSIYSIFKGKNQIIVSLNTLNKFVS